MQKISKPVKVQGSWRILTQDGVLVGWYATKALAEKALKAGWFS